MSTKTEEVPAAGSWAQRAQALEQRALSYQRAPFAVLRDEASATAGKSRIEAAQLRREGAWSRAEAARLRESAGHLREAAARVLRRAVELQEQALCWEPRQLLTPRGGPVLGLERVATELSREAAGGDREATEVDCVATDLESEGAGRERAAAGLDREAAERDLEVSELRLLATDDDRALAFVRARSLRDLEVDTLNAGRLASMKHLALTAVHEINNPLAALTLNLAAMELELGHPAEVREQMSDVKLAVERIASVVADLRGRLREQPQPARRRPVDLAAVIHESVRLAGKAEQVARVVVELHPSHRVLGERHGLGQVLTNLLLNAAQAISGPREMNQITVTLAEAGPNVRLEVHDTGKGIAPEVVSHIFDPYFTTRERDGGSGLGLALCQRIVSDHAGTLTVRTEVGKGSTFCVELPVTHEAPRPSVP